MHKYICTYHSYAQVETHSVFWKLSIIKYIITTIKTPNFTFSDKYKGIDYQI